MELYYKNSKYDNKKLNIVKKIIKEKKEVLNLSDLNLSIVISDYPNNNGWYSKTYYNDDIAIYSIINGHPQNMQKVVKNIWVRPILHELGHIKFDTLFSPSYREQLVSDYGDNFNCVFYSISDIIYMEYFPQYRYLFKGKLETENNSIKQTYNKIKKFLEKKDIEEISKNVFSGLYNLWFWISLEKKYNLYRENHYKYYNKIKEESKIYKKILEDFELKLSEKLTTPKNKSELSNFFNNFYKIWEKYKYKDLTN